MNLEVKQVLSRRRQAKPRRGARPEARRSRAVTREEASLVLAASSEFSRRLIERAFYRLRAKFGFSDSSVFSSLSHALSAVYRAKGLTDRLHEVGLNHVAGRPTSAGTDPQRAAVVEVPAPQAAAAGSRSGPAREFSVTRRRA